MWAMGTGSSCRLSPSPGRARLVLSPGRAGIHYVHGLPPLLYTKDVRVQVHTRCTCAGRQGSCQQQTMYRILRMADQIIWGTKYRACIRDRPPTYLPARLPYLPTQSTYLPTYLTYPLGHLPNFESRFTTYPLSSSTLRPLQPLPPAASPAQSWTLACRPHTHDKSHPSRRFPRRCAPAPAASSKSGRPGIGQGPPGDCTPQSRAVSAPPRLHTHDRVCSTSRPLAFRTRSRPSRHNTTSKQHLPLQFHPDLSSPSGPEG